MGDHVFKVKDLDTFSTEKAMAHYDRIKKQKNNNAKEIESALDFLDKFNKALEEYK